MYHPHTIHLYSDTTNAFNDFPNTDCLTTGNFNEKDFWSAQCMQCKSRLTTKNFNDSRQFVKFVKLKTVVELSRFTGTVDR